MIIDGQKIARIAIPKKLLAIGVHEWSLFDVRQQWPLIKRLAEASIKRWQIYPDVAKRGPSYEIKNSLGRALLFATYGTAMYASEIGLLDQELPDHLADSGYDQNSVIETLIGWAELERQAQVLIRDLKKQGVPA